MDLNMPKDTEDKKDETKVKQSGALTIMLGKEDKVYFYEGELAPDGSNFKSSTFKEIRNEIIRKKQEVIKAHIHDDKCEEMKAKAKEKGDPNWERSDLDRDFVVVIKPNEEATYKNTVDMLDEMTINNVKRFAMIKIAPTENDLIKATEGQK
jgi:Biopolymer transport protein ExbD/TolR